MGKAKAIYLLIFIPIVFIAWTVRADSSNTTATTETSTAITSANATETTLSEAPTSNSTFTSSPTSPSTTTDANIGNVTTTEQPLTTSNDSTTTSNALKNATELDNGTTTNVASTTATNITAPSTTEVVTTTQPSTTRTSLTTPDVTTVTDANEASQNTTTVHSTTTRTKESIVEQVKGKWATAVIETNLSSTALNNTRIRDMPPSEVIEIMIEYYKEKNQSELENFLKSEGVEVAKQVLENNPSILDIYIKYAFSDSQNISFFGLLAALHWMNDDILEDRSKFLELVNSYDRKVSQGSRNDTNQNSTSEEATAKGFILFILSNSSAKDLFGAICGATVDEGSNASECSTTVPPIETKQSIVERVKSNWAKAVTETNFSFTTLNNTRIRDIPPSEVIEIMIDYYKGKNESELENFLESEGVDEVAKQILENNPSILEIYIKDEFSVSQNISLFGLLAALHWMNDEILEDRSKFLELMTSYERQVSQGSGNDTNQNSTSEEATAKGFILFILSNSSAKDLFDAICGAAVDEGLNGSACLTTVSPTEISKPLSGAEQFEETWKEMISSQNYDFLSDSQTDELQAITPSNMTTGLIEYVMSLRDAKIQELVNANITRYVTGLLRNDESAVDILGEEAIRAFDENEDKRDVYYVYLSFINNVYSQSGRFEAILRKYVNASSPSTARTVPSCDTSTITARGLCCYTIATEAQDQVALRDSVCDELGGGTECINSFSIKNDEEETTPLPGSEGLSTGAIIGIVLGSVIGFALLLLIIFLIWKQCNKKKSKINPEDRESDCDDMEMDGRRTSETRPRELSQANGQPSSRNGTSTP